MPAPKGHKPYNTKGEGGRPPKWTDERLEELADKFEEWMQRKDSIWYESFCLENDFLPDQLTEFAKRNEKFSQVYKKSKTWQKNKLVCGGLGSSFNPSFTKFVMANTCGWTEKTQVSGDSNNPLSFIFQKNDGDSKELVNAD